MESSGVPPASLLSINFRHRVEVAQGARASIYTACGVTPRIVHGEDFECVSLFSERFSPEITKSICGIRAILGVALVLSEAVAAKN